MGLLKAAIDQYDAEKNKEVPSYILAAMARATEDLEASGIESRAVKIGDRMPDFELPNQNGLMRRFSDYLSESPVVLNVYRGGWCPYCNLEMKALHDSLPQIEARGARLVGMTPETPDNAMATAERHRLGIDILSDAHNRVAERLGLVFELPEYLRPIYQGLGIDIPGYNGEQSFRLPVPATYIVSKEGIVAHAFVNADYTRRMEPADIAARLETLVVAA
jgi:peroxiredoxin